MRSVEPAPMPPLKKVRFFPLKLFPSCVFSAWQIEDVSCAVHGCLLAANNNVASP